MLLYWHGFCDVSIMLSDVTLSKLTLDVHTRSDYTKLAEAVPMGGIASHGNMKPRLFFLSFLFLVHLLFLANKAYNILK